MMKTYARMVDGMVAELVTTSADIAKMYHPSLRWVEVSSPVKVGWIQQGSGFEPPPPVPATVQQPSPAQLRAQLSALTLQIAAMQAHS
jgi:hypothetical protein